MGSGVSSIVYLVSNQADSWRWALRVSAHFVVVVLCWEGEMPWKASSRPLPASA